MKLKSHSKYTYNVPQPNQKGIHIHIPKTAGVCVNNYLKDIAPEMVLSHATADFVRRRLADRFPGVWDKMFKFAFVRNPWDRLVSLWLFHQRHGYRGDFNTFLRGSSIRLVSEYSIDLIFNHPFDQRSFLCGMDKSGQMTNTVLVDFIGKMENFTDDFNYIREKLGLEKKETFIKINSHFKYKYGGEYRGFYNKEQREFVAGLCSWAIEKFGYEF